MEIYTNYYFSENFPLKVLADQHVDIKIAHEDRPRFNSRDGRWTKL